jgi:DNA-binding NarL/FixJ family response regulator
MQPLSVVLLQSDPGTVQSLIAPLGSFFHVVREAKSFSDLRNNVAKHRTAAVILDIEMASLPDVERLSQDFPGVCIVCNHRLADDRMWTAALSAGAADCCASSDPLSILEAVGRNVGLARQAAA